MGTNRGRSTSWLGLQVSGKARPRRSAASRNYRARRFGRRHPVLTLTLLTAWFAGWSFLGVAKIELDHGVAGPGWAHGVLLGVSVGLALLAATVINFRSHRSIGPVVALSWVIAYMASLSVFWQAGTYENRAVTTILFGALGLFAFVNACIGAFLLCAVVLTALKSPRRPTVAKRPRQYGLHITRANHWLDSARNPISEDEWNAFACGRGDFSWEDYSQVFNAVEIADPAIARNKHWPEVREGVGQSDFRHSCADGTSVLLSWYKGQILVDGVESETAAAEVAGIAAALGASLIGEDGERYSLPYAADG
jgi:hypothetical protein